ncbi:Flp pilus assembly protein CpaB [Vibrio cincinnatiensis]|uniref:Flp pilus assembly protein CpaB n=1 Tax=Vibrio cincinnatiensis TaxID=675 RepID=UPI001EDCA9E3|nr:Flp pilus assembly protein CpaB [Vibrio cincinnatiensis]MCG3733472.1 Flp pilus assembly protein CpaB [Vibrio cincinnatiensis]MCG3739906.1 Flp pilus assembly protein CpaB [Vibrio cincinnatiensis]
MNPKLTLLVAVFAISVGIYGLMQEGVSEDQSIETVSSVEQEKKNCKVYLARELISKGQPVYQENWKIEIWPEEQCYSAGLDQDMSMDMTGENSRRFARRVIEAGDVLYNSLFVTPESPDYLDYLVNGNRVPYPIEIETRSIVGGIIYPGTYVDILALSSQKQNLANDSKVSQSSLQNLILSPIMTKVKVLKLAESEKKDENKSILILELTRKQVATLIIAQKIAQLAVHKSTDSIQTEDLSANTADVLADFHSIKEFRATKLIVK